ncbi:MAG: hypothetical protein R3F61_12685 [Myxococcota bacterium]
MLPLLTIIAYGQERACDPVATEVLESHLATAEQALAALDAATATQALEASAEAARCLAVPIQKPLLARIAWGRAELAAADMDEEVAWTWIRLAQDAGVPEPPARLPDTHPLRRVVADARDPLPLSGPTGVGLHTPKKGTLYADGTALTAPELRVSTPHLLQVFDKEGAPYLGSWQIGAVFPSALLVPLVSEGNRARPSVEAGDELPPANWKPAKDGTEESYRDWIKKHPKGPWLQDAKDGIDDLHWATALSTGTELAVKQYVHDHPDGLHVDDAEFWVEDAQYRKVVENPSREAWEGFLELYPEGSYTAEAHVQIELIDWEAARHANDAAAYHRFLEAHPNSRNRALAERLESERSFEEARVSGLDSALKKFVEQWPESELAPEARAILGEVEFNTATLSVVGEVEPAVLESVRAILLTELERRKLPLVAEGGDATNAGRLTVTVAVVPNGQVTDIRADLVLEHGTLKHPLNELHIASKMLPTDDAGKLLGDLLVTNLRGFERWRPPGAEPPKPEPVAEDVKDPTDPRNRKKR